MPHHRGQFQAKKGGFTQAPFMFVAVDFALKTVV
jgi:hypothetical protein